MWILLLTSSNSDAKIHGGDLRSVKTISVLILSFGVSFSSIQFILPRLSSNTHNPDTEQILGTCQQSRIGNAGDGLFKIR